MARGDHPRVLGDLTWNNLMKIEIGDDCWEYRGAHGTHGYAMVGRPPTGKYLHRLMYEAMVGPIPDGMQLDHLCRNRGCVRPSHLEPVTRIENVLRGEGAAAKNARKTHCLHGHPFDDENTLVGDGRRSCRTCRREWMRAKRARQREQG